jgi:tRNA modification GTPase
VIAGPVNSGKSTLFNALAGEARAIVANEPGTTRDALLARGQLGPWPFDWYDTAGERGGAAEVEALGQALARELRAQADLVLWLDTEPARFPPSAARLRCVHSCADRVPPAARRAPWIAARDEPEAAVRTIERLVGEALELPGEVWRAGEGVPFHRDLVDALQALAREPERARRLRAIAGLLEPGSAAPRARGG